ncbi:thioesterase family protein [Catalinimonas sp. 4WD22]|uniref:acyl-CoA thioesterase n=1 Tax=Catalinimonas locisalis TaxID=3133978 RepID=UPI00310172FA
MYTHTTQIRVRYGETDQMAYVYYGNYASYFEVARVEALRHLGMSYKELEDEGIMMPVLENHSYYHHPAVYDDLLSIEVSIKDIPSVKISFFYQIYNEAGKLVHSGETKLAFMKANTKRPCRPPEKMIALLKPFFD